MQEGLHLQQEYQKMAKDRASVVQKLVEKVYTINDIVIMDK